MKKLILLIVGAIIVVACNNKTPEPKTEFVPVPGDTTVIVIPGDTVVVRDTVIITPGIPIGPSTPISVHPVKQIEGYDTLKVAKDGVVVGIIKSNETISAWKKIDTQKKLSEYTMEIDATSSHGKSFVNVYLTKDGEDKRISYHVGGKTTYKGKWSIGEANPVSTEEMLQKYGDWIVRDDYFEWSFGDTGNFIWRSGDSTQKGGEFEIRKFDVK